MSRLLRRGLFELDLSQRRKSVVYSDCNYFQVSESIWKYLYSIYGGGPELLIRSNVNSICIIDEQISKTSNH